MRKLFKITASIIIAASVSVLSIFSSFAVTAKENYTYKWTRTDDKWQVTDSSGDPVKGWAVHDGHIYYLNSKGIMKTGWIKEDGSWYYLYQKDDVPPKTQGKDTVKYDICGTLATDTWIDNYYVDSEGILTKTK